MQKATEIFEKHWTKRTGKPLDETTKEHMKYAIEAINEALLLSAVSGSADLKDKFLKKVEQIAQTYHDRLCFSGLTMEGQVCKCCESIVLTTTSIEHDSQDYSKDLNVCANCYSHIATWWKNNRPRKIAPN